MRVVRADAGEGGRLPGGEGEKKKKMGWVYRWVMCLLLPGAVPTFWGDHGFGFGL
jgi:hypothetical protein